jgi:hypothetical protein
MQGPVQLTMVRVPGLQQSPAFGTQAPASTSSTRTFISLSIRFFSMAIPFWLCGHVGVVAAHGVRDERLVG